MPKTGPRRERSGDEETMKTARCKKKWRKEEARTNFISRQLLYSLVCRRSASPVCLPYCRDSGFGVRREKSFLSRSRAL